MICVPHSLLCLQYSLDNSTRISTCTEYGMTVSTDPLATSRSPPLQKRKCSRWNWELGSRGPYDRSLHCNNQTSTIELFNQQHPLSRISNCTEKLNSTSAPWTRPNLVPLPSLLPLLQLLTIVFAQTIAPDDCFWTSFAATAV